MELEKQIEIAVLLAKFYGILAVVSISLNLMVIVFIVFRGLKAGPKADLYILSLALVDIVYSFGTMFHGLSVSRILNFPPQSPARKAVNVYVAATQGMTIFCCLLHLISITADRFIALSFPFKHRLWVTRRRILASIIVIWCTSGFLSSTQFWWSELIIDWVVVIGTISGSGLFILTYAFVVSVALRRRHVLSDATSSSSSNQQSVTTTIISLLIVLAFIGCNLPYCIAKLLLTNKSWTILMSFAMYTLLNMNAFLNPIVYTMVGVSARMRRTRARRLVASTVSLATTTRTIRFSTDTIQVAENRL